jgi:hypothetical protein
MKSLFHDESGGVLAYGAVFGALALGMAALSTDIGRMSVLRSQMQNRADAGAMGGAVQLDGKDGARVRAQAVAVDAISAQSAIAGNGAELSVSAINFYSTYGASAVAAASDLDAKFIEVILTPKRVNFMFEPVMRFIGGTGVAFADMGARAVAGPKPFICHAPPLMMCNPGELDPSLDPNLPANFGRQIVLKEAQAGGGAWAPGNFGLLALPDGSVGANDIQGALAAVQPQDCYTLDVTTATGSKTDKVKNGINTRFDLYGSNPAPNVISYPRDADIIAGTAQQMGNGDWNPAAYWSAKHSGAALPVELTGASRYQIYLYEQGLSFARNLAQPRQTMYPAPADLPAGYELVVPPGAAVPVAALPENANNPDYDGVPSQAVAANGQARRIVKVAILNCVAEGVNGHGTYPTNGNYVELFITEHVKDPPNAAIYSEIVHPLTSFTSPDYHSNVRLVR